MATAAPERLETQPASAAGATTPERRWSANRLLEGRGWTLASVLSDAALLLLAMGAALLGADAAGVDPEGNRLIWVYPPLAMGLMALRGMYRPHIQQHKLDMTAQVLGTTSVAAMCLTALSEFASPATDLPSLMARIWVFSMAYVTGGRLVLAVSQRRARALGIVGRRTLIVGAGQVAAQVERRLNEQPELGLRPIGFVDANPAPEGLVPDRRAPVLGAPADLARIVAETGAEHVVIAFLYSRGSDARLVPTVRQCEELGLEVTLVPRLFESINERVGLEHIGGMPLLKLRFINPKGWQFAIKHSLDFVAAVVLLLVLSPVLVAAALAVRVSSPGPVFFRQRRIGRDGQEFDIVKFRTMRRDPLAGANVTTLLPRDVAPGGVEGSDRRTPVGRFLRRTSLDELPQLVNVLKGEMSMVGPRPERPEFVELFEQRVRRYEDRHRVRSGLTGWAQVHGLRGKTSLSDRIEWDNYYIENWSLWLDFKILLMTVAAVIRAAE